jgi:hypothetical protein
MLHANKFLAKYLDMKWFVAKAVPCLLYDKQAECDCV